MINLKKERKIKLPNMISYGAGDVFAGGSFAILSLWIMFFYTAYAGLSPLEAGSIIAIARLFDAVNDPLMGYVSDNFHRSKLGQRFGRRGFFFIIGAPLVFLSYTAMWLDGMGFFYYLSTYMLFYAIYTLVNVPYETLAAEMTTDFKVRSKMTGIRMFFSFGSGILAAWLPGQIIKILGKEHPSSFLYMAMIFATLFMIVILALYFLTWERPVKIDPNHPPLCFRRDMKELFFSLLSTFRIRTFRQHVGMYMGGYVAIDILGAVMAYYIVFVLGYARPGGASEVMTAMAVVQFLCVVLFMPACIYWGNAPSYRLAQIFMLSSIFFFLAIDFFELPNALIFVAAAVMGIGRAGTMYVCWNIYSFIPDIDEMLTGQRREGIFAGVMTFVRKAVQAMALFLVGAFLEYYGLVAKSDVQSAEAVTGIAIIFFWGPLFFLFIGLLSAWKFRLTRRNHAVLVQEINRRKQGGTAEEVGDEARRVAETLTGWSYKDLWGNNTIINNTVIQKSNAPIPSGANQEI